MLGDIFSPTFVLSNITSSTLLLVCVVQALAGKFIFCLFLLFVAVSPFTLFTAPPLPIVSLSHTLLNTHLQEGYMHGTIENILL